MIAVAMGKAQGYQKTRFTAVMTFIGTKNAPIFSARPFVRLRP
jgi:hypothetical protein